MSLKCTSHLATLTHKCGANPDILQRHHTPLHLFISRAQPLLVDYQPAALELHRSASKGRWKDTGIKSFPGMAPLSSQPVSHEACCQSGQQHPPGSLKMAELHICLLLLSKYRHGLVYTVVASVD